MDGDESDNSEHSSQLETQLSCIVEKSQSPSMNDDPYALQNLFNDSTGEFLRSYVVPETFMPFHSPSIGGNTHTGGGPAGGGPAVRPGRLQVVQSRADIPPKLPQVPLAAVPPGDRQAHDRLKPAFVSIYRNLHRFYDEKSRAVAIISWKFCDAEEIWAITTCKLLGAGKQETMVAFC